VNLGDYILDGLWTALFLGIWLAINSSFLCLVHFLLTLPMRRAERARLFLDLIESAIELGRSVEETIISVARSRDLTMGPRFHLLAAWLEQNLGMGEALAKVPQFLPPQVTAMLKAGQKIGDLKKVLPAARMLLKDAVSQTRSALSYLVILTFVITPIGICLACVIKVLILPKFMEIGEGAFNGVVSLTNLEFVSKHFWTMIAIQAAVLLLLWLAAFVYMGGPRVVSWFRILERLHYWLPWRRMRLQRDFSAMLAILLDSGLSEPEAVALAGDCTDNTIFRHRAARAVDGLKQGLKLTQAVQVMDDAGEFGWRLTNAFHGGGGFFKALAGWNESLDAKSFQLEQAAAHSITTALVLWTGLFVAVIVITVFMFLISIIDAGVLW
jgi:type II secretory pathway component PulF